MVFHAFAVRWVLEQGVPIAVRGGRKPSQMDRIEEILRWSMDGAVLSEVRSILAETIQAPVGPECMAAPTGLEG